MMTRAKAAFTATLTVELATVTMPPMRLPAPVRAFSRSVRQSLAANQSVTALVSRPRSESFRAHWGQRVRTSLAMLPRLRASSGTARRRARASTAAMTSSVSPRLRPSSRACFALGSQRRRSFSKPFMGTLSTKAASSPARMGVSRLPSQPSAPQTLSRFISPAYSATPKATRRYASFRFMQVPLWVSLRSLLFS